MVEKLLPQKLIENSILVEKKLKKLDVFLLKTK